MRIHEMRELTDQQLRDELTKTDRDYMNLRFRSATNQLPDTNLPRLTRRSIARLRTVMNERGLTVS